MERPLTQNMKADGEPLSLREYELSGGYQALRQALTLPPQQIQEMVKQSNLKGRGGGGFPTGAKWSFVPMEDKYQGEKYVVVNADEMEPGTMKDRLLMERDPHQLIEGTIISAYAIGAQTAYIFLRWAYKPSQKRLEKAIAEAYASGYLGKNILGSPFSIDIHLHMSAGRYMCGEETGLLNALESRRATPRSKPPYPAVSGLWGKPTVVNNVETICCVPHIVKNGSDWFRKLSHTDDGGTKIYGVSGKVKRPGLWELPMGTTVREILEHAGGMQEGRKLRGIIPGGASTNFLTEEHLDVRMDFVEVEKYGSRMGTGTMIVLDDAACPVGFVLSMSAFFARESCGWCTPCREGLPWIAKILCAFEEGDGKMDDLDILEMHTRLLGPGNTFCALAPGAIEPVKGLLQYFRADLEKHIQLKKCPWR